MGRTQILSVGTNSESSLNQIGGHSLNGMFLYPFCRCKVAIGGSGYNQISEIEFQCDVLISSL